VLAHQDRLLNLGLLNVAVSAHLIDSITIISRDHLVILHFIHLLGHSLVVALLELQNLVGTFASFLNLLPRLDLLLLEESDTICQQLSITLHTVNIQKTHQSKPFDFESHSVPEIKTYSCLSFFATKGVLPPGPGCDWLCLWPLKELAEATPCWSMSPLSMGTPPSPGCYAMDSGSCSASLITLYWLSLSLTDWRQQVGFGRNNWYNCLIQNA